MNESTLREIPLLADLSTIGFLKSLLFSEYFRVEIRGVLSFVFDVLRKWLW